MTKYVIGPMDPPIRFKNHGRLTGAYVLQCGSEYGRILFTHGALVEVEAGARDVLISDCVFVGSKIAIQEAALDENLAGALGSTRTGP